MTFDLNNARLVTVYQRWLQSLCALVCIGILFSWVSIAEASIVLPEAPEFVLEDISTSSECGSSCSSSQGSNRPAGDSAQEGFIQLVEELTKEALVPGGGSSSSSSTSTGGTSGTSASALSSASAHLINEPGVAGWLSGERRISLPGPIGNDLLRPPQAA